MAGPSEFGGNGPKRNGVYPAPHIPTPSERLMLIYRTGDESGLSEVDTENAIWTGLLPLHEQIELRRNAGDLDVGQEWERLKNEADAELQALQNEGKA